MRRAGPLIVAALAATVVVPIILGGKQAIVETLNFSAQGYGVLFAVIATSWLARGLKLQLLLRRLGLPIGFTRAFAISLATDFAFISTPGGVGGYAAGIYYVRREGASISAATTLTAADQILDLAFFAFILPIAGLTLLFSELPRALALLAFATSALMIGAGVCTLLARRKIIRWLIGENALTRRWPGLRRRQQTLQEFLVSLGANTRLLVSGGWTNLLGIGSLTAVQWLSRYGALWVVLALLGHRVSFALTLLLQSLVLHAAMWTGVPAGGGGAELGLSATLAAWVPMTSMATALLLWRMTTFYVCLIVGAVAIALLARARVPSAETQALRPVATEQGAG
jgi:uncharacterized protein (TIRG00374 family)